MIFESKGVEDSKWVQNVGFDYMNNESKKNFINNFLKIFVKLHAIRLISLINSQYV
mgnify:CR=1 FL=1